MSALRYFLAGETGPWHVTGMRAVRGVVLAPARTVTVVEPPGEPAAPGAWRLRGAGSNHRYASQAELDVLGTVQPGLGRPEATCAALIPIKKSHAWWRLAQDERLALFCAGAGHNWIGLNYLPGIARQLLHCRDLGEPFDFLTWFEFAPGDAPAFDELLRRLRATEEWSSWSGRWRSGCGARWADGRGGGHGTHAPSALDAARPGTQHRKAASILQGRSM